MSETLRQQLWIVAAAALVFFTNLGATALWDEDEPLYAACAREMLARGDWVVPVYNGQMFPEKPPLMFWLMIAGFKLFGITEFAVRFWSALAGVATGLVTYHLGRLLFGRRAGFWAGIIMASTLMFTVSARAATVDSTLVLLSTTAMLLFVRATAGFSDHVRLPRSWWTLATIYALLGLAVLAKGPVGVVLPVAVLGLFLAVTSEAAAQRPASAASGRRRWAAVPAWLARVFSPRNLLRAAWQLRPITAVLIVAAIALPWYVMVGLRTEGEWLSKFLGEQNLQRMFKPMQGHSGPFWYYLPAIMIGFFPWSLLLGPTIAGAVRRIRGGGASRRACVFLACWVIVFVAFWSLVSTKLPHYVLPAYPALALLTGAFIDAWLAEPARYGRWWLRSAAATLVVVGLAIAVAIPVAAAFVLPGEALLGLVGLIFVAGGVAVWLLNASGRPQYAMSALAVSAVVFLTAMFGFAALRVDRHQNARPLMAAIHADSVGRRPQLAGYRLLRESTVFYAGEPVEACYNTDSLRQFLDDAGPSTYVVTRAAYAPEIESTFPGEFRVLWRDREFLRKGEIVVLARRPSLDSVRTAGRMAPESRK